MICCSNQLTGSYIRTTLAFNGLMSDSTQICIICIISHVLLESPDNPKHPIFFGGFAGSITRSVKPVSLNFILRVSICLSEKLWCPSGMIHYVKSGQIQSFFWSILYGVNLRIQSEYRKIRTRKNSVLFIYLQTLF